MKLTIEPGHMLFELTKRETTIGRSESSDWCVPSEKFSRTHCIVFQLEDGKHAIMDPGSKNGVIVDGERIPKDKMVRVDHRSHIQLANTYYLHFEMPPSGLKLAQHSAAELIDSASEEQQIKAAREHRAKNPVASSYEPVKKKSFDFVGAFRRLLFMTCALAGIALTYIYFIYFKI